MDGEERLVDEDVDGVGGGAFDAEGGGGETGDDAAAEGDGTSGAQGEQGFVNDLGLVRIEPSTRPDEEIFARWREAEQPAMNQLDGGGFGGDQLAGVAGTGGARQGETFEQEGAEGEEEGFGGGGGFEGGAVAGGCLDVESVRRDANGGGDPWAVKLGDDGITGAAGFGGLGEVRVGAEAASQVEAVAGGEAEQGIQPGGGAGEFQPTEKEEEDGEEEGEATGDGLELSGASWIGLGRVEQGLYRLTGGGRVGPAIGRVGCEETVEHGLPAGWDIGGLGWGGVGRVAGEEVVKERAEAVEVATGVERIAGGLFGRHVAGSAGDGARGSGRQDFDGLGEAEVGEPDVLEALFEEDVRGFEVAMQDALGVGGFEGVEQLESDAGDVVGADRLALVDPLLEGSLVVEGHDEEGPALVLSGGVDFDDVRVAEGGDGSGFGEEAGGGGCGAGG